MKQGWEIKKLGGVCEILNGYAFKSEKYTSEGVRVLRITNVQKGYVVDDDPKFYPKDEMANLQQYILKENDLLMSLTGNVGRVGLLQNEMLPAALNQRVACLRIKNEQLNINYLFHFLNSDKFEHDAIFSASGIAQKNMSTEWLKKSTIPIPPHEEHERIVAELDCLSGVIEKKKQQLKELDALAQSIFYQMFGDPISNEKGWEVKKLGEVCNKITDGTHNSPKSFPSGVYMDVTAKNIKKDGFDLSNITYVPEDVHKSIYSRCNPVLGDILYIKDGATTGIAMINSLKEEFSLLSSVALLKCNYDMVSNIFIKEVLNSTSKYNEIRGNMGGAAITRLTINKIENIYIPLPPITLQQEFAEKIEAIEKQKEIIKQSIKETETLFNSRMNYYFN